MNGRTLFILCYREKVTRGRLAVWQDGTGMIPVVARPARISWPAKD